MRGRPTVTTYEYDDQGRMLRSTEHSPWTDEDRVLMLAWRQYQDGLCPGCRFPKEHAWHPEHGEWFEHQGDYVCYACTVRERESDPSAKQVTYPVVVDTYDPSRDDGEPFRPLASYDLNKPNDPGSMAATPSAATAREEAGL